MELQALRALWRAVILQAVQDVAAKYERKDTQYLRSQAEVWFRRGNPDLATVCHFANFDIDYVLERFQDAKQNGFVWRKDGKKRLEIAKEPCQ